MKKALIVFTAMALTCSMSMAQAPNTLTKKEKKSRMETIV